MEETFSFHRAILCKIEGVSISPHSDFCFFGFCYQTHRFSFLNPSNILPPMCQIFHFLVVRSFICLSFSSTRGIRGISEEESSRCFSYSHIYSLIHPTMIHPRALSSFLVIFATIAASSAEQRLVRRVLGDVSALDLPFAARIMFP